MAEEIINRRKSQLFLQNISPVTDTYDELVRKKLKGGKFPTTVTGVLKMLGMLILLFSASIFLAQPLCENTDVWYAYLLPLSALATMFVQLVLYLIFSLGCTIQRPGFWIYLDIVAVLLLSVETVISSVITYIECNDRSTAFLIPAPFGMAGGIILVVSCGSLLMLYRYVEVEESIPSRSNDDNETSEPHRLDPRISVYA